jgi:2-oxoglutarate ferredoxin oxidoreductase subunit alpha
VGLFRPINLSPYPYKPLEELSQRAQSFLVVEMNTGQMLEDVRLAVSGRAPIEFYGRLGGVVPFPDEILDEIHRLASGVPESNGDPRKSWMQRLKTIAN